MQEYDAIVLGAGAAGLMCALTAGGRGRRVLLLEHNESPGRKILISGGGRCNFTNLEAGAERYLSSNPHFAKSALKRYTQWDFMDLLGRHGVTWHEKTLGQLFCDQKSDAVLNVLLEECRRAAVDLRTGCAVEAVEALPTGGFAVSSGSGRWQASKVVVATGGLSVPKIGATDFAYRTARRFGLPVTDLRPALVPFTFGKEDLAFMQPLTGVAMDVVARTGSASFAEAMLFTHRGLSGPAILQISSYWREGEAVNIDLLPGVDALGWLMGKRVERPKAELKRILSERLPNRFVAAILESRFRNVPMAEASNRLLHEVAAFLKNWTVIPAGTEGYRTAEVTAGGVDTSCLSSRSMECREVPGLYFIGEAVDVTGWLGGYNFQWAWSSGWACGQEL